MSNDKSNLALYADECIPVTCTTHLKTHGVSVQHAFDSNFVNKADELHFKKSKKLGRILISLDKDFNKFKGVEMGSHPGIILISVGNNTPKHINNVLDKALKVLSVRYVKHSILRITIDKISKEKNGEITTKKI